MKDSFIFYDSFLNALDDMDSESELELYRAITHYALRKEEPEVHGMAKIAFHLIKPLIDANYKRYEDGLKGGRPKSKKSGSENKKPQVLENVKPQVLKNEEIKKPNVNVNDNVTLSFNEKENGFSEEKERENFKNSTVDFFKSEYKKIFETSPFLSASDYSRLKQLSNEHTDFNEMIPVALKRLKRIKFHDINFTPTANWLLKGNNFERVMNGEFEKERKKTEPKSPKAEVLFPEPVVLTKEEDEHIKDCQKRIREMLRGVNEGGSCSLPATPPVVKEG